MKKTVSVLLILFICLSVFAGAVSVSAQLDPTLYAAVNVAGNAFDWVLTGNNLYTGMYFIPNQSFDPTIFSFGLTHNGQFQTNVPQGCELLVWEMAGGAVTNLIIHQTFDATNIPTSGGSQYNVNISTSGGVTFKAGQQYLVALTQSNSSPSLRLLRFNDLGSLFGMTGGVFVYGASSPSTTYYGSWFMLRIYGQTEGSTHDGNLFYVFNNAGFDTSDVGGNSISLSLMQVTGEVATTVIPVGGSYAFSGSRLAAVSWNFSSALDLTRTIEFLPSDGVVGGGGQQVFSLHTASADYVVGSYVFSVVDYTSSVQFVEVSLGGVLIERKNVALAGAADFSLYKGLQYTVTCLGIQGAFSQSFISGNVYSSNIIVLAGSFGDVNVEGQTVFFNALRALNNSGVQIIFNDPADEGSFNFTISKKVGAVFFEVYVGGVGGEFFPFNFVWDNAEVDVTYQVRAFQYDGAGVLVRSWVVDVAPVVDKVNPWAALISPFFSSVDTLPGSAVLPTGFRPEQLPVAVVLALFLAIFSWASHGKGCLLCWVVALIMVGLGWWVVSLPAFGFALVLSIFIALDEGKQTVREI